MERVERTNMVVVRRAGEEAGIPSKRNPYTMEIDQGRNCYACRGFRHMAHHCRNRGRGRPMEGRKVENGGGRFKGNIEQIGQLKEVENLEALD